MRAITARFAAVAALAACTDRVGAVDNLQPAQAPNAIDVAGNIRGEWWTLGFRSRVRAFDCAGLICAEIVWLWDPRVASLGEKVLFDLRAVGARSWRDGRAYNPADGNTYKASVSLLEYDRLLIEGCVLFFCQEQIWIRVGTLDKVPRAAQR